MKKILFFLVSVLFIPLAAQTSAGKTDPGTEIALIFTISFIVFVIATLMYIIGVMDANVDLIADLYFRIKNHIIPPEGEVTADVGHVYDGIRELDNRIPPWFNYLLESRNFQPMNIWKKLLLQIFKKRLCWHQAELLMRIPWLP
jgi:cytochrome c oxidase cbb3-type subunit 3